MKKYFPLSFKFSDSVINLLIGLVVYIVVGAIGGVAIAIVGAMPIIGIVAWVLGLALDIYVVVGIVLLLLAFFGVVK